MFFKDKKVVVTGGSGFVGTHLVQELLKQEAKIRVSVHKRPMIIQDKRIEIVQADLNNPEECRAVCRGMQYVFHGAGAVASAAVSAPIEQITTNLVFTARMFEAAWAENVEGFQMFSSSTGYPVTDYPVKEEEMWSGPTYDGYFGYGWMRRYLERLGEFVASKSKMKVACVRPTAIYGRYDNFDPKNSHVIPALIRRAVAKENPFVVWGGPEVVRDFLHVTDMTRGCVMMMEKCNSFDPTNIGYGKYVTIGEIVPIILKAAGNENAKIVYDTSKPTAIPIRMVDCTKAKEKLGFEPALTLEEGLTDTVKWYISQLPK